LQIELDLAKRMAKRQTELLAESATTAAEADQAESAVEALTAQIQGLDVELAKTTIRAPFSGVLGLRQVSEGAWVTPSTPLITIADTSALKIDFRVPERHAAQVQVGTEFDAHAEGTSTSFSGVVLATEPSIDETSRSLLVRGIVKTEGRIVPGTFAKVQLPVKDERAILLPPIAVIPGLSGVSVYVMRDGVAHLTPVEQGVRTKDAVQITSGLSPGDQVIVSNLLRLRDGARVQIASGEP
jgi:membrane fusion protein (multidrug efflux system)